MSALYIGYTAALVYVALPIIYWLTAREWYRSVTGRALMMLLTATAAAFILIATSGIFGAYEWRELVRYVLYTYLLVAGLRLGFLFIKVSRDGPPPKVPNEETP